MASGASGDGDADVVMALGMLATEDESETNQIVWYENIGRPGTGDTWTKHEVGPLPFAFEEVAADLDGDADLDIVATAWGGSGRIVWFENGGNPAGAWRMHSLKDNWPREPADRRRPGRGRTTRHRRHCRKRRERIALVAQPREVT